MKTVFALVIVSAVCASQASALSDLTRLFAGCTGRLSAEIEHAWLMRDRSADAFEAQRLGLESILEATLAPQDNAGAMAYRIDSKIAQARLLETATFGVEAPQKTEAAARAAWHLGQCQALLLDW